MGEKWRWQVVHISKRMEIESMWLAFAISTKQRSAFNLSASK